MSTPRPRRPRPATANTYTMRRVVALAVLALVVVGGFMLARAAFGGGGGAAEASAPATDTTTAPGQGAPTSTNIGTVPENTPTDNVAQVARANVPVLCYHQIRPMTSSDSAAYVTEPQTLDDQLDALQKAGYTTITLDQYVAHIKDGATLPAKPILLTFDDGSEGHYTEALPRLKERGMVATFFIMTVTLGNQNWLTREQVQELDAAGMSIGSHTWDHHDVTGLRTAKDFRIQFTEPRKTLEELVGHPVTVLAYPFGLWNRSVVPRVEQAGYTAAFQLAEKADPRYPMYSIRRIAVGEESGAELVRRIRGAFPPTTPALAS